MSVDEGSAFEKAGIQPGDVLLSWERPPNPPDNPEPASGELHTPFDWFVLLLEQHPRGPLRIVGRRSDEAVVFEAGLGGGSVEVRPDLSGALLDLYLEGRDEIEDGDRAAGIAAWARLVDTPQLEHSLRCWMYRTIGTHAAEDKDWSGAQAAFDKALSTAESLDERVQVRIAIANARGRRHEHAQALELYSSALEIAEASGIRDGAVWKIHESMGNASYLVGDFEATRKHDAASLEAAMRVARNSLQVAESLNNVGQSARMEGRLEEAWDRLSRSMEIKRRLEPQSLDLARTMASLGNILYVAGHYEDAFELHEKSLEIREERGPESLDLAVGLHDLASVYYDVGDVNRASANEARALEIVLKREPGGIANAYILYGLGRIAVHLGELQRAEDLLGEAVSIIQEVAPASEWAPFLEAGLGKVRMDLGDLDGAEVLLSQALERVGTSRSNSRALAEALQIRSQLAEKRGDRAAAADFMTRALHTWEGTATESVEAAECLDDLGRLALDSNDFERAEDLLARALSMQRKIVPDGSVEQDARYLLGRLALARGHAEEASRSFAMAIDSIEHHLRKLGGTETDRASFRASEVDVYQAQIDAQVALGRSAEALYTLERARAQTFLEQLAERAMVSTDVPAELETKRQAAAARYDTSLEKLLELSPETQADQVEELRKELREIRHDLDDVEQEVRAVSPRLASLRYPQPLKADEIEASLDPGTLVLAFSVGKEEGQLFAVRRDGLQVHKLALGKKDLAQEVGLFNQLIREQRIASLAASGGKSAAPRVEMAAERLYRELLSPAEDWIGESERLLIVPDGPLHTLPWGALVREIADAEGGESARYLVEWKPIHLALSATVYAELRKERGAGAMDPERLELAALGDPSYPKGLQGPAQAAGELGDAELRGAVQRGRERGFSWEALPQTRVEVEEIARLFPKEKVRTYLGADATEERIKKETPNSRILHIAAHGYYDEALPLSSAVVLSIPEKIEAGQDNGLLQAWEIFESVRLKADLVVLSACESASGKLVEGEGLIGLTRAFQYAGARSVMAGLWKVEDRATRELMVRFYRHLREGKAKDEALRAAQVEMLRGAGSAEEGVASKDLSAPYQWAAFQIYGDWQ